MKSNPGQILLHFLGLIAIPWLAGIISVAILNRMFHNFLAVSFIGSIFTLLTHYLIGKSFMNFPSIWFLLQQGLLISVLLFLMFFSLPLNIDRSISVWLLAKTYDERSISETQYYQYAREFFTNNHDEIDRRISEQMSIGNLVKGKDETYFLTSTGKKTVILFRFIANLFGLHSKYAFGK